MFFKALPAGTIVNKAEETDKHGYTATSKYVFANGTAADALDSANLHVLTQNGNSLVVTNKKDVTVPTGVFYDHLPLIALIVVSGVAIGAGMLPWDQTIAFLFFTPVPLKPKRGATFWSQNDWIAL